MLAMSAPPADYFDPDQSTLTWLQAWYMSNCNGDWEHGYGVSVRTLDNPATRPRAARSVWSAPAADVRRAVR